MHFIKSSHVFAAGLALAFLALPSADAADMPKRKSGLWEMKMEGSGSDGRKMHGPMTLQICVDQGRDHLTGWNSGGRPADGRKGCSRMEAKRTGNHFVVDSVCDVEGTRVTVHSVISGDLSRAYRMESTLSADLPKQGRNTRRTVMDGKWLGPCKPGQVPGAIVSVSGTIGAGGKYQIDAKTMETVRRMQEQSKAQNR
jgi:Protein of unknown function (DUF3617)